MARGLEAFRTVISAHAALTDAAEMKVLLRTMQDGVVDDYVSGRRALKHVTARRPFGPEVKRKRPGSGVYIGDGLFERR